MNLCLVYSRLFCVYVLVILKIVLSASVDSVKILKRTFSLRYIGRKPGAAAAGGNKRDHDRELYTFMSALFGEVESLKPKPLLRRIDAPDDMPPSSSGDGNSSPNSGGGNAAPSGTEGTASSGGDSKTPSGSDDKAAKSKDSTNVNTVSMIFPSINLINENPNDLEEITDTKESLSEKSESNYVILTKPIKTLLS